MVRYASKEALVADIVTERLKLEALLQKVPSDKMCLPGVCEEWSVKDMLAHLAEWQLMFFGWYEVGLSDQTPDLPAKGYNWAQTPQLNQRIYEKYKDAELQTIQAQFMQTHKRILEFIENHTERELLEPGYYDWTKGKPLSSSLAPNTASHYRWARRLISKWLKKAD